MPTKPRKDGQPRGAASFAFSDLISAIQFSRLDLSAIVDKLYRRYRYGGLGPEDRLSRLFDRHLDLASLPIGLFDQKALPLPDEKLPASERELAEFLRRLIHVGEDTALIEAVLVNWNVTVDQHAGALWRLRGEQPELFNEIVSGRLGSAVRRICRVQGLKISFLDEVFEIIARQALLWCAMDVQMVTARARVSFTAPMGKFLGSTMWAVKPGTVLRLMRQTASLLQWVLHSYQPTEKEASREKRPKIRGTVARLIARRAASSLEGATPDQDASISKELDRTIPYLRETLDVLPTPIHEVWARVGVADESKPDNSLKSFHARWYSDLSPLSGMAVALVRYAQAEEHIRDLVAKATRYEAEPASCTPVEPLPPLPPNGEALIRLRERALLLADHYRRAILRDCDYRSRSPDDSSDPRDPLDRSGWTFVGAAIKFLHRCGKRKNDAHRRSAAHEDALTFFALDVVPELRLAL